MFDKSKILSCFTSLVGWRESAQAPLCYDALSPELTTSDSGLYVNDIAGMDLQLINEAIGKDETTVNDFLENTHESCAIELVNDFTILQKEKLNTKALLSNLSTGVKLTDIRKKTIKRSRFVGYEICPTQSNSVKVTINELGVQFDTLETLDVFFYASSQLQPLKQVSISNTKESSLEWLKLTDFIASYISEDGGAGDKYYIGYYEDDLTGQAIETFQLCGTCGNAPAKKYSQYASIRPIEIASGKTYVDRTLFDVEQVGYTTETFGLNLKINVECDITPVVCENKQMLANSLQKKIAIRLFWEAYNSDRINRVAFINKEDSRLMAEKLELDLEKELKTLSMDFSQIDKVCLPCSRKSISRISLI
jgi:hypothetical protein